MVQSILIFAACVLFVIAIGSLLGRLLTPKPDRIVSWGKDNIHALDSDQFTVISELISTIGRNLVTSELYLRNIQFNKDRCTLRLRMRRHFFYSKRRWFSTDYKWDENTRDFFLEISNVNDCKIDIEKMLDSPDGRQPPEMSLPHVTISHDPQSRSILISDAIENFRSFSIEVAYIKLDAVLSVEGS
jgi:hypothetical protein